MDTSKLLALIDKSGLKKKKIADSLGVSYPALQRKLSGEVEFKASEINALKDLLHITSPEEFNAVFFTQIVDK